MPPKNKKQLEEEAKRLEQQQKRKEEEERKLQEERKKYAAQTLSTGLLLPISNQLITDFVSHQSQFLAQKLKEVLLKHYSGLHDQKTLNQLIKQTLFLLSSARTIFGLTSNSKPQGNQQRYLKTRVVCGIYLQVFLNNHKALSQQNLKSKEGDERLVKELILNHSKKTHEKQQKIFSKTDIMEVLKLLKQKYFNHFFILHKYRQFPKREDKKVFNIYMSTPLVESNTQHTIFIDLSANKSNNLIGTENEDRSDGLNQ